MTMFIQLVVTGLAMGCIYTLMSLGVNMIWSSMQVTNFANGQFVMVGAYMFGVLGYEYLHLPYAAAAIFSCVLGAILGVLTARYIYNPLRHLPVSFALIGTVGLSIVLREAIRLCFGALSRTLPGFLAGTYNIHGVVISKASVLIIVITMALLVAQELFFRKTIYGKAMRAVAQDREAATLMGINVPRFIEITVGYCGVLFALAGILLVPILSISTTMADTAAQKAFCAAILGGFGNSAGAIIGGPIIGILENLFAGYVSGVWKNVVSFAILILVLLVLPKGITGKADNTDRA